MSGRSWIDHAKYGVRARADLTASVTHWTRRRESVNAFSMLRKIISERRIRASSSKSGFIKANQKATCFTEIPVSVMSRLFRQAEHDYDVAGFLKWEPYGLSFLKNTIYKEFGGRPVLYLSHEEYKDLVGRMGQQKRFAWRVVRFEYDNPESVIDFSHEREWRTPDDVDFSSLGNADRPIAFVSDPAERDELLNDFPPKDDSPIHSVFCLSDLRRLG